ncbi:MAG: penicillin-binding transpeptidase domain-containing protein [Planctomycetota bacterium]
MSQWRLTVIAGIFALFFLIIVGRLVQMQLLDNEEYEESVERKRRRIEIFSARRGSIYDRNSQVLAVDTIIFDISFQLPELDPRVNIVPLLSKRTGIPEQELYQRLDCLSKEIKILKSKEQWLPKLLIEELPERAASYLLHISKRYPEKYKSLVVKKVEGKETSNLYVIVPDICRMEKTMENASHLVDVPIENLLNKVVEMQNRVMSIENRYERRYEMNLPYTLCKNIDKKTVAEIEVDNNKYQGLIITTRQGRYYPNGSVAAHIIGYLRQINKQEYESLKYQGRIVTRSVTRLKEIDKIEKTPYFIDDTKGCTGLEAQYDYILTGSKGARILQSDTRSLQTEVLNEISPESGKDIYISIDINVQKAAEEVLAESNIVGAVVAIVPDTGEILAMASSPSYDLNVFRKPEIYKELQNPPYPLINRALSGFAPGSGMKLITAVADIEELHDSSFEYFCRGYYKTPLVFRCWKRSGHGTVNITSAIEQSCNCFFFAVAEKMGYEKLRYWAELFGIGKSTGIDLPGESDGLLPTPEWKADRTASSKEYLNKLVVRTGEIENKLKEIIKEEYNEDEIISMQAKLTDLRIQISREKERIETLSKESAWVPGDTRNLSIGQGYVLATPLQMAQIVALIANGGKVYKPHLIQSPPNRYFVKQLPISEETLKIIRAAMGKVVSSRQGTAYGIGLDKYNACAKTGTAEIGGNLNNAWIIGYAPAHVPEIAFAVVAQSVRGHGGDISGPIAEKILAAYFAARKK